MGIAQFYQTRTIRMDLVAQLKRKGSELVEESHGYLLEKPQNAYVSIFSTLF